MNRRALFASVAALLVASTGTARAGSVTYLFEQVGTDFGVAYLVFDSPPASPTSGWGGAGVLEFDTFNLITLTLFIDAEDVSSDTGARLDGGQVTVGHEGITISTDISSARGQSTLSVTEGVLGTTTVYGDWVASIASVPEPSSLLPLALGIGGVSLAWVARFVKVYPLT